MIPARVGYMGVYTEGEVLCQSSIHGKFIQEGGCILCKNGVAPPRRLP